jgi:hypothetical protein
VCRLARWTSLAIRACLTSPPGSKHATCAEVLSFSFPDGGAQSAIESGWKAKHKNVEINIRVVNPSYLIRTVPPVPEDRNYCSALAFFAVHAAMSGFTGASVGLIHGEYVLLPVAVCHAPHNGSAHVLLWTTVWLTALYMGQLLGQGATRVDRNGRLWLRVQEQIGQPNFS